MSKKAEIKQLAAPTEGFKGAFDEVFALLMKWSKDGGQNGGPTPGEAAAAFACGIGLSVYGMADGELVDDQTITDMFLKNYHTAKEWYKATHEDRVVN